VTQPFEIDLHSEFLKADLFLAMGRPTEAARILEPVVAAEPANEAALEMLARSYFASAQLRRAEEALTRLVALAPPTGGPAVRWPARWSGRAGPPRPWRTTGWPTPSALSEGPRR
jgi:tetratricopeptide (TPR) repeat protein